MILAVWPLNSAEAARQFGLLTEMIHRYRLAQNPELRLKPHEARALQHCRHRPADPRN